MENIHSIQKGFNINQVVIRDQDTREIYWDSKINHASNIVQSPQIMEAHLPARILKSKAITRSVEFSSVQKMSGLSSTQKAYLGDQLIEQFNYQFGFVIPNSVNNWDQTIITAAPNQMIPAHILSGNLFLVITFYEKKNPIYEVKIKIFYD